MFLRFSKASESKLHENEHCFHRSSIFINHRLSCIQLNLDGRTPDHIKPCFAILALTDFYTTKECEACSIRCLGTAVLFPWRSGESKISGRNSLTSETNERLDRERDRSACWGQTCTVSKLLCTSGLRR